MKLTMKRQGKYLTFAMALLILSASTVTGEGKSSVAYQLATLHTKSLDPIKALTSPSLNPSPAILREFEWIMATLKDHCLDRESAIGQTVVETWRHLQRNGDQQSLLDVARKLAWVVKNSGFYGKKKVNFSVISQYVLKTSAKEK